MKWGYLVLWGLLAARELPQFWQEKRWKELALWLILAGAGLALAIWLFWGGTSWRLAEWLLEKTQR